jgi:hypothetical protein
MTWIIHFAIPYLQRNVVPFPLWFSVSLSVALVAVLSWRIRRVGWLFSHGVQTVGVITNLRIAKDRGRLAFVFDCNGRRVYAWMPIHKTKAVMALVPGDQVDVLYDEAKPSRAIVRKLFES